MSKKTNLDEDLLKGIEEFEKNLKLKDHKIEIDEWVSIWSKEHNTNVVVVHAKKDGKDIIPSVEIPEWEKLADFPASSKEEKDEFLEEILRRLRRPIA